MQAPGNKPVGKVNLTCIIKHFGQLHNPSEGLWAKILGDQYDMIYVMMRAAAGTAYEGGLMFFTIEPNRTYNSDTEPRKYPFMPPRVLFYSYYPGYIHENLYAPTKGGKVCMSILGTWPGEADEQWETTLTFEKIMQCVYGIMDLKSNGSFYTGYKTRTPVEELHQKMLYGVWHGIYRPLQEGRANPVGLHEQPHTIDFPGMFAEEIRAIYPQQRVRWLELLRAAEINHPGNMIAEVGVGWQAQARVWMESHPSLTQDPMAKNVTSNPVPNVTAAP
jgi:ubiquitin-protein ligase